MRLLHTASVRMRSAALVLVVCGAACSAGLAPATELEVAYHRSSWCLPDTAAQAGQFRRFLTILAVDSTMQPVRVGLGVPPVEPTSIMRDSSEARCQQAAAVVDSLLDLPTARPVHLATYGAYYAAYDPEAQLGNFQPVFFFNSAMAFLGAATF